MDLFKDLTKDLIKDLIKDDVEEMRCSTNAVDVNRRVKIQIPFVHSFATQVDVDASRDFSATQMETVLAEISARTIILQTVLGTKRSPNVVDVKERAITRVRSAQEIAISAGLVASVSRG